MKADIQFQIGKVNALIELAKDSTMAIKISNDVYEYWICNNKPLIKFLKQERKELKKALKGKPNKWE